MQSATTRKILLLLGLCGMMVAASHATSSHSPETAQTFQAGMSLTEALLVLQSHGLQIIFSSNVVRPEMTVEAEPVATEPRLILDELLAPHGLEARDGPGETIVVVGTGSKPVPGEGGSSLRGVVRSRPNMDPVAGATVQVLGSVLEATTLPDGSFSIPSSGTGSVMLETSKEGYVTERSRRVVVTADQPAEIEILLTPLPVLEEELVVTPSRISLLRLDPAAPFALGREEILSLPHLGNDFFRALTLLPGTTSNDVTAQFHVRGGRRDETQILLDGQELYESFHLKDFDNALSVVVPETIGKVDLTTGGFPVEYGDRMSGVLDMTTAKPEGPTKGRLGVGILSAHAGGAGAFQGGRGGWIAEIRRGSTDFAGRLVGAEAPNYWDAFGKLDYRLDPRNGLQLNLLLTDDEFELDEIKDGDSKQIETDYDSSYLWLTHQSLLGSRLLVESAASVSQVNRDRNGRELEEDAQFLVQDRRTLEVLGLRQAWSHELMPTHFLRWGFELRRFASRYDYASITSFDNPLARIRQSSEPRSTRFQEQFGEHHHSLHIADRWRSRESLIIELGLRFDHHSQTSEDHLSPRLNLVYALGRNDVLRLAWGRFNQSQRPYELQIEDGESRFHPVERSLQWILGYEKLFIKGGRWPGWELRAEIYRRDLGNPRPRYENLYEPLNNFPEAEPDRVRIAPDRSVAQGLEIFLRGKLGARTRWWVNYAYATTEDSIAGQWVPRSFDQTHTFNLDLEHRLGTHWKVNLAWRYHTGWPTTPIALAAIDQGEGGAGFAPVLGDLNSEHLSNYHRLDLRASRSWRIGRLFVTAFTDIQNVYNHKNLAGFDFEIDDEEGTIVANRELWAGFLPSLGVSLEF